MSLFDDIAAETNKKRTTNCQVRSLLDSLDDKDRQDAVKAMATTTIDAATIATVLERRGFHITGAAIRRHRRDECSCKRSSLKSISPGAGDAASGADGLTTIFNISNERAS